MSDGRGAIIARYSVLSAASVVALGMLLGRVTGLVRELALAARYGLTWEADVAMLAISLPDLLNAILVGGAVSAVLIPEFHRLRTHAGAAVANQMACQFLTAIGLTSTVAAFLVGVFASGAVGVLAPGLAGPALASGIVVLRVVVVALPFCALAAVTTALLQSRERIVSPAFGTLIFNAVIIVAMVFIPRTHGCIWLSGAVVGAACLRLAAQVIECLRAGILMDGWHGVLRFGRLHSAYIRRYFQTFGAVGLTVFIPVVARAFASHVEGGIACFSYGYKLVELPFGLLSAVLSMAVFPRISRLAQERGRRDSLPLIGLSTNVILLITMPAIVFMVGAAEPVVALLFQRGKLGPEQVLEIARLTRIAYLSLPALVLVTFATSIFHAYQDTRMPFLIGLGVAATCVVCCSLFAGNLVALMGSIAAIQWLHVWVLAVALHRRHGIGLSAPDNVWRYAGGAITSVGMGLVSWSFRHSGSEWLVPTAVACVMSGTTCLVWFVLLRPIRLSPQTSQLDDLRHEWPSQRKLAA